MSTLDAPLQQGCTAGEGVIRYGLISSNRLVCLREKHLGHVKLTARGGIDADADAIVSWLYDVRFMPRTVHEGGMSSIYIHNGAVE